MTTSKSRSNIGYESYKGLIHLYIYNTGKSL